MGVVMPLNAETAQARTQRVVNEDSTDIALFVRSSQDDMTGWNRQRIVDALLRETFIDRDTAEKISRDIEVTIQAGKVKTITGPLIREMVNAKLLEMGLEEARRMHTRLGVPLYDVDQLLVQHNKENANVPHGPEATNLTLAEGIKKEYALLHVFTPDVADAHLSGDLHLHDLGFIDRPYCSGQSLEYIKKFGLNLPHALSMAKPAKHAEVLLAHMVKFAASLQSHFAGAIGWDAINLFYAPYLEELDDDGVKQLAQMMIYEFSQQAVARGGQAIFSDVNIYWEVPKHFVDVPAIGPGGVYTGKTYGEYEKQAQRFAWALFEVYKEGDAAGRPFFFPKPLVHITEKFFKTDGHMDFLHHICEVASVKGNTYFVFDRGDTAKISECCRLSFKLEASDIEDAKKPWKMRYSALQNITINLPRIAYKAEKDDTKLFSLLTEQILLAVKGHEQKKKFIERLLAFGPNGPLSLLAMDCDGQSYLRLKRCTYLVGMVGLNELIRVHLGEELHGSSMAMKFGLKVIAHMNLVCQKMTAEHGMRFVLEQTPAESTAYRFAKLDLAVPPAVNTATAFEGGEVGRIFAMVQCAGGLLHVSLHMHHARPILISAVASHAIYFLGLPVFSALSTQNWHELLIAIGCVLYMSHLVVAGTSNWGAYGVVAALSYLRGRDLLHSAAEERRKSKAERTKYRWMSVLFTKYIKSKL